MPEQKAGSGLAPESVFESVRIHEVGPRDGFQSLDTVVPTEVKLAVIEGLVGAGFDSIELAAFVNPRKVPQMADAAMLTRRVLETFGRERFRGLVPNVRGAELACEAGLRRLNFVISASESHNRANVGRTIDESVVELIRVRERFADVDLRLNIATVFSCPYQGRVPIEDVDRLVSIAHANGISQIAISDTMGDANPRAVREVVEHLLATFPTIRFFAHLHDTDGMAMVNCHVAAQLGIADFETSVAGLGGCPFAPGAGGNLATEDLVNMFESIGVSTGINLERLLDVARYVREQIQPNPSGRLVLRQPKE
ncbi:MAG: hydroxymethylglutaryl-CoA lyase [Spirochaetaceae bacterium]|nr:MAG: hydroxymethylglutaryl-CoA lyase [Spirochaetaceae bacterium]